jgi:hypothetical protein
MATDVESQRADNIESVNEKSATQGDTKVDDAVDSEKEIPDPDAQHGVRVADAVTLVWTTPALILAYVL